MIEEIRWIPPLSLYRQRILSAAPSRRRPACEIPAFLEGFFERVESVRANRPA